MKKKILIIVAITIFLIIAIICLIKIKKAKDIEAYRQVGEYVLDLFADNRIWRYGSEEIFLEYCNDEEIIDAVRKDIYIERIEVLNQDAVIVFRKPWLWGLQGYIVVRTGKELPYSELREVYESPKCELISEGIYSFKWISIQ